MSLRTAADYLSRIHAGLDIVEPDSVSHARAYVVRDWRERADLLGAPTKTGSQLVGASSIYNLGFQLMDDARSRAMRGLDAAITYRNGLILSVGVALPQRARALSALAFDSSLRLTGGDAIYVRIPAAMLKLREDQKRCEPFDTVFHNDLLADALHRNQAITARHYDQSEGTNPTCRRRRSRTIPRPTGVLGDEGLAMTSASALAEAPWRGFESFSAAAVENAESRIHAGIHFRSATDAGLELGRRIGEHVLTQFSESAY